MLSLRATGEGQVRQEQTGENVKKTTEKIQVCHRKHGVRWQEVQTVYSENKSKSYTMPTSLCNHSPQAYIHYIYRQNIREYRKFY